MKSLTQYINEWKLSTDNKSIVGGHHYICPEEIKQLSSEERKKANDELNSLYDTYCCIRGQKQGESDNVGGTIVGILMYMLGKFYNDGLTCENSSKISWVNDYLCCKTDLTDYKEFINLGRCPRKYYEKCLWVNINIALKYLRANKDLFLKPETQFYLFS